MHSEMPTRKKPSSSSATSNEDEKYAGMDERKRKRMISNRDSARRSRMRKQKLMEDLSIEINRIQCQNNGILSRIDEVTERFNVFEAENRVLRAQGEELTERLRSLIALMENKGMKLGAIDDVPDHLFKPWQIPCPLKL